MTKSYLFFLLLASYINTSCSHDPIITPTPSAPKDSTYLALGDSYTIAESVDPASSYPMQISDSLKKANINLKSVRIIARTGWTTGQLQSAIDAAQIKDSTYTLVSLLIGVNNQYRGYSIEEYKTQFTNLLTQAIQFAKGVKTHVFVISIPDYAFTPYGQGSGDPNQISAEIDRFNAANAAITKAMGVQYFDITPISRQGIKDKTLVANDGLHPSAKQYSLWTSLMLSNIKKMIAQ